MFYKREVDTTIKPLTWGELKKFMKDNRMSNDTPIYSSCGLSVLQLYTDDVVVTKENSVRIG